MAEYYKNKVIIVGCGPGLKAYISPKALYHIKRAEIIIGSRRLLKLFPGIEAKRIVLEKNYRVVVNKIGKWVSTKQIVVLVSGDPCFFSYTRMIVKTLGRESCIIIPGVSSVQLAFATIGECWDDACFLSLHGRDAGYEELVKRVREWSKVAVLTDNNNTPAIIARHLLKSGIRERRIVVCENLSLPKERIREVDVTAALNIKTSGMVVMIIMKK